jgi:dual specificity tyrosine-phosphorylation-regulated kinase 2/3/4
MIHDSIAYRYEIISQLGRGSFGRVFRAFDHKKKEFVALKLIKCQKKFQEQAKVEIAILQTAILKDPKFRCNVVRMKGSFVFRGHSCIAF